MQNLSLIFGNQKIYIQILNLLSFVLTLLCSQGKFQILLNFPFLYLIFLLCFDVFEGENIPEGKKSIAVNVTIQSEEKTLNENDLDNINKLIISSVESKSGAKIRS